LRNPEALFVDPEPSTAIRRIEASEYTRSIAAGGLQWIAIPDLGQSKAGLVALPQGRPPSEPRSGPRVEYEVSLPANAGLEVRLQLAPTLDTTGRGGVRIGLSLDNGPVEVLVSELEPTGGGPDNPAKQRWHDAVIANRVTLTASFDPVAPGTHTLTIWRVDDNAVVEALEVEPLH
jgi:hypothetical protein